MTTEPLSFNAQQAVVEPLLLTVKQAANVLAVSERTVWQLVDDGELTPIRIPGRAESQKLVRFALADLRAWIAACAIIARRVERQRQKAAATERST